MNKIINFFYANKIKLLNLYLNKMGCFSNKALEDKNKIRNKGKEEKEVKEENEGEKENEVKEENEGEKENEVNKGKLKKKRR